MELYLPIMPSILHWKSTSSLSQCHAYTFIIGPNSEPKSTIPVVGKSTVEGFCLTLPGKQLDLSVLLKEKKFRNKGNKEGALRAMRILEEDGLGRLDEKKLSNKSSVKVRTCMHITRIY